jgi:adenylate cyclase
MNIKFNFSVVFAVLVMAISALPATSGSHFTSLITETSTGEFEIEGAEKVDSAQAFQLLQDGVAFVDVRREIQFKLAHVPNAINLEVNTMLTEQSLGEHVAKDQKVVFYCSDKKCYRSATASAMALSWGYTDVVYYAEGWSVWTARGYPRN